MSTFPLRVGLKFTGQGSTVADLLAVWQIADDAGFDNLWAFDHLASIGALGPDRSIFDGWTMLAAMSTATKRVRIGLNVTGNTYRHPVLLAKIATTVDHFSNGRLEFGIGAAWAEIEHKMYGIAGLENRVGRLSESLQIIRALWTEERVNFAGRYYTLTDAIANPKPVQKPFPPIWIGSSGDLTLKLTARYANVWDPSGQAARNPAGVQSGWNQIRAHAESIGRDPSEIQISINSRVQRDGVPAFLDQMAAYRKIGVSHVLIGIGGPADAEWLAKDVLPALRQLA